MSPDHTTEMTKTFLKLKSNNRTSLVVQRLRIHLAKQGTAVWYLVQEDPTRRGAAKSVHQLLSRCPRICEPRLLSPCATTAATCEPGAYTVPREASTMRGQCSAVKTGPHFPQLERPRAAVQIQNSQINTHIKIYFKWYNSEFKSWGMNKKHWKW